jgi:hypothetical protein
MSPVTVMGQIALTVSILLALTIRYYSGRWTEFSPLFRISLLIILSLAAGASVFSFVYFLMYFSYAMYPIIATYVITILTSALIGSCCFGRLSVVKPRNDVWKRWFKERNGWEEERRTRALAHEDEPD